MVGTLVLPNGYVANLEGQKRRRSPNGSSSEGETLIGFLENPPQD
jgi:hypothetical protein